jgi:DNA topoisomerase-1
MQDAIRVFAGQCTVTHESESTTTQEGLVVVLVKPDNTVLVHDAAGYRPAGWLTRADSLRVARRDGDLDLLATKGSERLHVRGGDVGAVEFPVSAAGDVVGECPACEAPLVRHSGLVSCIKCGPEYRLPGDATMTDGTCDACGLPTISVTRGEEFELCLDRACTSLDEAVRERFEGEWTCPDCHTPLTIERERTLVAACPECESSYHVPSGELAGTCECGLPRFETGDGARCLDPDCEATTPAREGGGLQLA